jgi:general secretion pathway protein C
MRLNITQWIKDWFIRVRDIRSLPAMDITLLRPFLILLAITILTYEGIDLFYKIIGFSLMNQPVAVNSNVPVSVIADNSQPKPLQDYGIVTERNLFLTTLKAVSDKQSEGVLFNSEQKTTDFDLKGTIASNSSFGYIIIEEHGGNKQKLYRLGDMIGSAKLVNITRNAATLRSGGVDVTVKVKSTIEGQLLSNSPDREGSSRNMTLSKKTVNENLSNLNSIMNQATVRPFLNKGIQEGYIVSNILPNSLYEKAGLQNGDIIVDVNNKKIQSTDNLLQMIGSMQSGSRVTLNVKRNGRIETINYSFE